MGQNKALNLKLLDRKGVPVLKCSGHLIAVDWKKHHLFKAFLWKGYLGIVRVQTEFPCELGAWVDYMLRGHMAGFQELSLISSF